MKHNAIKLDLQPRMNIRKKILLSIGVSILVISGMLYWHTATSWQNSISKIENEKNAEDIVLVTNALNGLLLNLDSITHDWATRDDTFRFVSDLNQQYVIENLTNETFTELELNLFALINNQGELIYTKAFDLNKQSSVGLPEDLYQLLKSDNDLLSQAGSTSNPKGLVMLKAGPLLLVSQPILDHFETKPQNGSLIMGYWLDKAKLANLENLTQFSIKFLNDDDPQIPNLFRDALNTGESGSIFINTSDQKSTIGYALLNDLFNKPSIILQVQSTRSIYSNAQRDKTILVFAFLLASLASFTFIYLQLDKYLIARLAMIGQQVKDITANNDLSKRLDATGDDEFSTLIESINQGFDSLDKSHQQLSKVLSEMEAQTVNLSNTNIALQKEILIRQEVEKALKQKSEQQLRLIETANNLSQSLESNQVLKQIASGAREIVQADGCGIYLLEANGKTLKPVIVVDPVFEKEIAAASLDVDHSFTGQAIITKHGLFFNDATTNEIGYQVPGTPLELDEKIIVAPLIVDNEVVGAICLDRQKIDFTIEDLRLVEVFASYASTALKNARTHDGLQREVNERRQAEAALRHSEARYRNLFNRTPIGLYRTSVDGEVLDANQALADMLGYPDPESLKKQRVEDINVDPADRLRSHEALEREGVVHNYEMQLHRSDGQIIWVNDTFRAMRDSKGNILYYEGSMVDITERKKTEQALQESEARNRSLIQNIPLGIYRTTPGPRGKFLMANPAYLNMLGFESEQDLKKITPASVFFNSKERRQFSDYLLHHGKVTGKELHLKRKDGTPFWALIDARVVKDDYSNAVYFDCNIQDINQRKQAEKLQETIYQISQSATEAKSLDELYARVHELIKGLIPAENFYVALYDPAISQISYPYYMDEYDQPPPPSKMDKSLTAYVIRHGEPMLVSPDVSARLMELGEVGMVGTPSVDWLGVPLKTTDNTTIGVMVVQTYDEGVRYTQSQQELLSIVSNQVAMAIERKRAEEKLAYNAFHDDLSGLPNRSLFMDRLDHAIKIYQRRKDRWFAILFLDLDHFKTINDSLGHVLGDQLLISVARRLGTCLRPSDTIARFGGDEFVILLEELEGAGEVTAIAERILDQIVSPFNLAGHDVVISTSIGIVYSSFGYEKSEEVLRDADIAMYQAKASGRGRYVIFSANMRANIVAQLELEKDFRQAIERKEWVLHYQPILSLGSGKIIGFEALVRWKHPIKGLIQPVDFIPFAEETGLIIPMGEWVLQEACQQMSNWHKRFPVSPPLTISVNLSSKQFSQPELFDQIETAIQKTSFDPHYLKLEITESAIMKNAEQAIVTLNHLQQLGVQVHIDDFGTGYSSLVILHLLPINAIKIDHSFISGNGIQNYHGLEIAQSIVRLAHDLKMETIAEGVETQEQFDKLKLLECEYAQGFHISFCLSEDLVEQLLTEKFPSNN